MVIFITGISSGFGLETARLLSQEGHVVYGTVRREVTPLPKVKYLRLDVRDAKVVQQAVEQVIETEGRIDVLVNNAGLASGLDPIQSGDIEDWEKMIDTNVKGLLYLTRKVSPMMIERKSGHIINIDSIAGKEVYANGNVYCATKHAVDALTKGMRNDMLPYGVKVSQVSPGMVNTEFSTVRFHGDKERADHTYDGLTPLYAEDIADFILYIVTRPAHVCINDMIVMPAAQANSTVNFRKK